MSSICILIISALCALFPADSAKKAAAPALVHPETGKTILKSDSLTVRFIARKQHYNPSLKETDDPDIRSPKSVNIHPSGDKYYVNSLEGGRTVVFDFHTQQKLKVIMHEFSETKDSALWAPASGLFSFSKVYKEPCSFTGKPVESAFSHGGRYLWIPYYRRSYDMNAQEPSAMAVIDTESDSIVRMFETGPLPKMVAVSPDGTRLAVTHWGNNTVGLMDISSEDPTEWKYLSSLIVDYQLQLNFSHTRKVDRDVNSGYCLRGTVFTPDNKYLLVGCMGSGGGIAVIDLEKNLYLGRVLGLMPNLRHIIIKDGMLFCSINNSGYVLRIPLDEFLATASKLDGDKVKKVKLEKLSSCKVPAGARTIEASPDGRFIFVSCNFSSCLAVVDAREMKLLGTIPADSYPVGLDVSKDGRYVLTTSQARGQGGNAVDIFEVTYL